MRRPRFVHALGALGRRATPIAILSAAGLASPVASGAAEAEPAGRAPGARIVTLSEVERAALARQPQILIARAATSIARAQAEQLRSPLLPQVTGTASYMRAISNVAPQPGLANSTATATSGSFFSQSFDFWSVGVTGTQLVYDFGQTCERYRAAQSTVEAQREQERTARVQTLSAVRRAYFNARANRELVDVARETLADQNHHMLQVQGFVQVGTQPPIAAAQQRALVANAQVQLITAQNNYETAKAQLNQAAGVAGGTDFDVGDEEVLPVEDEDQPLEALVVKALAARPEMANLQKQREAQEDSLSSAKGGYGPALSATASASARGREFDTNPVPNWTAGFTLTWLIYQGGLTQGQVHQAEAQLESIDAQRSLAELQVRLDVDSARLAVQAAKATIGAAEDAVNSAREQLRLAEQRYATGVGSIIELTDAQVAYTSAAAQVVQARYGLAAARAQLLAALGRT